MGLPGSFALHLTKLKSRCHWTGLLPGGPGEESASKCVQVVGRTQFLAAAGPRSPFLSSPLVRGHCAPRGSHSPSHVTPSIFKATVARLVLLRIQISLTCPSSHQPERTLLLKGSCDWISVPHPVLPSLLLN